jgi:hypothetical protein
MSDTTSSASLPAGGIPNVNATVALPPPASVPPPPVGARTSGAGVSLEASITALQVNSKQQIKRANKAREAATELRKLHWPDVKDEDLWLLGDRKRGGFAQVPRTLAMFMNVINDIAKRQTGKSIPAGKTYLVLWLRVFDEGFVKIDSEADAAFEAGYSGERNVTTFRSHMQLLKNLGFIDYRQGTKGPMQYVLLLNPYKIVKKLHDQKLIPTPQYAAILERAAAIGSSKELTE